MICPDHNDHRQHHPQHHDHHHHHGEPGEDEAGYGENHPQKSKFGTTLDQGVDDRLKSTRMPDDVVDH